MKYYPLFLDLKAKKAVVIGGGRVAERKAAALIKAGAAIELVSPSLTPRLQKFKAAGKIKHKARNYAKGDLKSAFVVAACTSSGKTNIMIANDAKELFCPLINVADNPSEGNFIVPASLTRGPLTIAISTEGASPAIAKMIRKEIQEVYDADFAKYLKLLGPLRRKALTKITDDKKRIYIFKKFSSPKIISTLRKKGFEAASKEMKALLK
ncbi:MAG: bifunctional precorrin-2 dehydrogenase/sirohydrochlorin ferrochelatase [Thermodesulfovibrionia bacterium]|nr:bifunctional precorrin-2 dehydrogenase/sirohydrochlorin ferrochelatase [Thermodesulfovibrionia bacterium]